MNLYWIWLAIFAVTATALALNGYRAVVRTLDTDKKDVGPDAVVLSIIISAIGVWITYPIHLGPFYELLTSTLPNQGTFIYLLTLWSVLGVSFITMAVMPAGIVTIFHNKTIRKEMQYRTLK